MVRAHIYVKGRVQGVFYRVWAKKNAKELRLTGFVRNLVDGRIEIVAEGKRQKLTKLAELIEKGPQLAKVEHVDVIWEKATGEFEKFEIIG